MKRLFIALSAVVIALSVMAKERVSVLYVGGSPDFDNIAVKKDSAIVAKSAKMRTADFEKFLRQRFYKVKAIQGKDYTAEMSKDYDVTVFDGKPKALRGDLNVQNICQTSSTVPPYALPRRARILVALLVRKMTGSVSVSKITPTTGIKTILYSRAPSR